VQIPGAARVNIRRLIEQLKVAAGRVSVHAGALRRTQEGSESFRKRAESWEIVGVHQDPATEHTALGDALLDRDVYDAIRGGRR
jgi:hypothetical protein